MMSLNLRQTHTEKLMLMFNQIATANGNILIYDRFCENMLTPLFHTSDLRENGVTLESRIEDDRRPVGGPAVYFVQPTESNLQKIIADASSSLSNTFHLNFTSPIPRNLASHIPDFLMKLSNMRDDLYLDFVTLDNNLYSLAQPSTYVELNDPSAGDKEIEEIIERVTIGLLCVLVTLRVVPVIRCPRGGSAEMVASLLDRKLRDLLSSKNNVFTERGQLMIQQRPLLCIFDRNFDLSVGVQHDFRYGPLVHDLLGLKLNKLDFRGYDHLDSSDPFWSINSSQQIQEVCVKLDVLSKDHKTERQEIKERMNQQEIKDIRNTLRDEGPELLKRKLLIQRHTNMAAALSRLIKERSIDVFSTNERDLMVRPKIGYKINRAELMATLKGKGTKMDKLRYAILYLISRESINQSDVEAVEAALIEAEADTSAFQYVKEIKSLAASSSSSREKFANWAKKTLCLKSISPVSAGLKNPLARTVEALAAGKSFSDSSYLFLDPINDSESSGPSCPHVTGPYTEVIVFVIGGGNFAEFENLQEITERKSTVTNLVYGASEMLTGDEFVEQLGVVGRKMQGLGGPVNT